MTQPVSRLFRSRSPSSAWTAGANRAGAVSVVFSCVLLLGGCSQGGFSTDNGGDGDGSGGTTSSTGGTSNGGGTGTGGASMGEGCAAADLTFKLESLSADRSCLPSPGCGPTWITIRDVAGNTFNTDGSCQIDCESCSPTPCPDVECSLVPFDRSVSFTFTGEFFAESACDGTSCNRLSCAPAGDYIAEICLERAVPPADGATECIPAGQRECDEVPFTWPLPDELNQILTISIGSDNSMEPEN